MTAAEDIDNCPVAAYCTKVILLLYWNVLKKEVPLSFPAEKQLCPSFRLWVFSALRGPWSHRDVRKRERWEYNPVEQRMIQPNDITMRDLFFSIRNNGISTLLSLLHPHKCTTFYWWQTPTPAISAVMVMRWLFCLLLSTRKLEPEGKNRNAECNQGVRKFFESFLFYFDSLVSPCVFCFLQPFHVFPLFSPLSVHLCLVVGPCLPLFGSSTLTVEVSTVFCLVRYLYVCGFFFSMALWGDLSSFK